MANITLMGASYTDVPAVTLPQTGGGTVTFYENGGGSATEHEIYLELGDGTDATIPVYYDDAFIGTIITASAPATYGGKTVDSASLDGVEWYRSTGYTTLYEGTPAFYTDATPYYLWIPELANVLPTVGSVWRITIDGTAYVCTAQNTLMGVTVGNPVHVGGADDGSGMPVAFYNYANQAWSGDTTTLSAGNHTVKVERQVSA